MAESLIEGMAQVEAADVAVAGPSEVIGSNAVSLDAAERACWFIAVDDQTDGCWADEESVVVEMHAGIVTVVMKAELSGVSLREEILNVNVGDINLLMARVEGIQSTIGIFLEQVEPGRVPRNAVRFEIAEQTNAGLFFGEEKSAKVARELLNSSAHGHEVIVHAEIFQLGFNERFLKANVRIESICAFTRIDIDESALAGLKEVEINLGRDAEAKVDRTKSCVAVKEIEGEPDVLREEGLLAASEELRAVGICGVDAARKIDAADVGRGEARAGEVEEPLLSEDREVAFELIAIERVVPMFLDVRDIGLRWVPTPLGHSEIPAVGLRVKVVVVGRKLLGL